MEQSKRQQRKMARGAGESRPVRRAADRLKSATAGYEIASKKDRAAFTKPGAQKHW